MAMIPLIQATSLQGSHHSVTNPATKSPLPLSQIKLDFMPHHLCVHLLLPMQAANAIVESAMMKTPMFQCCSKTGMTTVSLMVI